MAKWSTHVGGCGGGVILIQAEVGRLERGKSRGPVGGYGRGELRSTGRRENREALDFGGTHMAATGNLAAARNSRVPGSAIVATDHEPLGGNRTSLGPFQDW
jgi:hypothetical protein